MSQIDSEILGIESSGGIFNIVEMLTSNWNNFQNNLLRRCKVANENDPGHGVMGSALGLNASNTAAALQMVDGDNLFKSIDNSDLGNRAESDHLVGGQESFADQLGSIELDNGGPVPFDFEVKPEKSHEMLLLGRLFDQDRKLVDDYLLGDDLSNSLDDLALEIFGQTEALIDRGKNCGLKTMSAFRELIASQHPKALVSPALVHSLLPPKDQIVKFSHKYVLTFAVYVNGSLLIPLQRFDVVSSGLVESLLSSISCTTHNLLKASVHPIDSFDVRDLSDNFLDKTDSSTDGLMTCTHGWSSLHDGTLLIGNTVYARQSLQIDRANSRSADGFPSKSSDFQTSESIEDKKFAKILSILETGNQKNQNGGDGHADLEKAFEIVQDRTEGESFFSSNPDFAASMHAQQLDDYSTDSKSFESINKISGSSDQSNLNTTFSDKTIKILNNSLTWEEAISPNDLKPGLTMSFVHCGGYCEHLLVVEKIRTPHEHDWPLFQRPPFFFTEIVDSNVNKAVDSSSKDSKSVESIFRKEKDSLLDDTVTAEDQENDGLKSVDLSDRGSSYLGEYKESGLEIDDPTDPNHTQSANVNKLNSGTSSSASSKPLIHPKMTKSPQTGEIKSPGPLLGICELSTVYCRVRRCRICNGSHARWVTIGDRLAPESPCLMCGACFDALHRRIDGSLHYTDFEIFPYVGDPRLGEN